MWGIGVARVARSSGPIFRWCYREQATFHTDQYAVYKGVIPAEQHRAITKQARKTNHIERFNNTLRQRVSRLVRETLSFSKKLAHHISVLQLLESLDNDELGPEAPASGPAWRSATPLLQFGNQGTDTQRLQRALRRAGKFFARIDGSFGRETEDAVRSFQREAGLDDNGVVDTAVWNALPSEHSDSDFERDMPARLRGCYVFDRLLLALRAEALRRCAFARRVFAALRPAAFRSARPTWSRNSDTEASSRATASRSGRGGCLRLRV